MIKTKMYELNYLIFLLIIILSTFQTIAGVGILVLGTPILILFGFDIVQSMIFLLPLSIFNSVINFFYPQYTAKTGLNPGYVEYTILYHLKKNR